MHLSSAKLLLPILLAAMLIAVISCGGDDCDEFDAANFDPLTDLPFELQIASPDFQDGGNIPIEFTCDGENRSPLLSWDRPPDAAESVVLIVDDPDAPTGIFTHWVIFNMDGSSDRIQRGVEPGESINGGTQGRNNFIQRGYGGPCPPRGDDPHEYRFMVFALNARLNLTADASAQDVLTAIRGSVIANGSMSGMYARR